MAGISCAMLAGTYQLQSMMRSSHLCSGFAHQEFTLGMQTSDLQILRDMF